MKRRQININKTIFFLIVAVLLQVGVTAALVIVLATPIGGPPVSTEPAMLVLLCLPLLSSCVTILNLAPVIRQNRDAEMLSQALESLEKLNHAQRAQRHDFLNHLQVVYSLIEMDDYAEAHDYIERIYADIQRTTGSVRTAHPAVNAIMQAKLSSAQNRGVAVTLNVTTRLEHLPIEAWELCRVIGNIVDNALTAMEGQADKRLSVTFSEDLKNYRFTFENNGPAIEPSLWQRIFEPGFSTNSGERGMGLAICRDIFRDAGGALQVFSDASRTVFEGTLPKAPAEPAPKE